MPSSVRLPGRPQIPVFPNTRVAELLHGLVVDPHVAELLRGLVIDPRIAEHLHNPAHDPRVDEPLHALLVKYLQCLIGTLKTP